MAPANDRLSPPAEPTMSEPALAQPLLDRLDRLERENRRFKLVAGVSTLLLFTWTACSVAPQAKNVVSAERFVLLATDGTEKGYLEVDPKGDPVLLLKNEKAQTILTTNGPSLLLRGTYGKTGAFMGIDSKNSSKLELCSKRIIDGVRLVTHEDGSAGVYVTDVTGRERGGLESLAPGGAAINLRDDAGRVRAQFGVDKASLPNLLLLDANGARRIGMILQEDDNALLEVEDAKGR